MRHSAGLGSGWAALRSAAQPVRWREALICAPAILLILGSGLALDRLPAAAVAAGGAFVVGFGASRELFGLRWGAMVAAMLSMSAATLIGSLAGRQPVLLALISAVAAAGCARLALKHEGLWWVSLQAVVSLFIAGYYAGPPSAAFARAGGVALGGGAEIALVALLTRVTTLRRGLAGPSPPAATPPSDRRLELGHTLRAFGAVLACEAVSTRLGFANRYWAPMTVMLVLKPGLSETHTRGLERLTGTAVGCIVGSGLALLAGPRPFVTAVMVAVSAGAAYAFEKANYAVLASCITSTVVLLTELVRGSVLTTAGDRLLATVIGGGLALLAAGIAPHRGLTAGARADRAPA